MCINSFSEIFLFFFNLTDFVKIILTKYGIVDFLEKVFKYIDLVTHAVYKFKSIFFLETNDNMYI